MRKISLFFLNKTTTESKKVHKIIKEKEINKLPPNQLVTFLPIKQKIDKKKNFKNLK